MTLNNRSRFDLEEKHSYKNPALRRVNAPDEISKSFFNVMAYSKVVDAVADLIGPNIKLHHTKINSKLPNSGTVVKWHQDFPFTPHTNDDLITALIMIDNVTLENGPLEVWPGSHKQKLHSLWEKNILKAKVNNELAELAETKKISCVGPAGSVCLMHTRLLHGSSRNLSSNSRTLFICVYSAEDAYPLTPSPVPNKSQGLVLRGIKTNTVRTKEFNLELPEFPKGNSFFEQQTK